MDVKDRKAKMLQQKFKEAGVEVFSKWELEQYWSVFDEISLEEVDGLTNSAVIAVANSISRKMERNYRWRC